MTKSRKNILINGILRENPVFILVLGCCPTLAVTDFITNGFFMGIAATAVLICSNIAISALRKIIPSTVRIPCYIVIIAGFVTIVQMLTEAFFPALFTALGTYLALITVNCIILGRAEMFARENTILDSALDGLSMGLGFTLALMCMSFIREVFGNGTILGIEIPFLKNYTVSFFKLAPGGFFVFGCLIALVRYLTKNKKERKDLSCNSCPCGDICHK